jgi:actin-related protein 5
MKKKKNSYCYSQFNIIIFFLGGKCDPQGIRRINLGGLQMISYLHRLLQLKYPSHLSSATFSRAEVFHFITILFINDLW